MFKVGHVLVCLSGTVSDPNPRVMYNHLMLNVSQQLDEDEQMKTCDTNTLADPAMERFGMVVCPVGCVEKRPQLWRDLLYPEPFVELDTLLKGRDKFGLDANSILKSSPFKDVFETWNNFLFGEKGKAHQESYVCVKAWFGRVVVMACKADL